MLIRLALRNALRNLRRTLLTAGTVVAGVSLMVVALTWLIGVTTTLTRDYVATAGHIRIVDPDFAEREELQPLYENIEFVEPLLERVRAVPGVTSAHPRISAGAVITASEAIGEDFTMVVASDEAWFRDKLDQEAKLSAGTFLSGTGQIVLGRKLAIDLEAELGDDVLVLGQTTYGSMSPVTLELVGTIGGDAMVDRQAFITLEDSRWLLDLPDGAMEIAVYGGEDHRAGALRPLVEALREVPELEPYAVQGWFEREPWNLYEAVTKGMNGFLTSMVVFLTALAIFNTMTMSVMERAGEIGVMRAMGLSRAGAVLMFVVEATVIGLIGGIVGAAVGGAGGLWLETHGLTFDESLLDKMGSGMPFQSTFYGDLTPEILVQAVLLGLLIAVVGAFFPALRAAAVKPVVAMRARR